MGADVGGRISESGRGHKFAQQRSPCVVCVCYLRFPAHLGYLNHPNSFSPLVTSYMLIESFQSSSKNVSPCFFGVYGFLPKSAPQIFRAIWCDGFQSPVRAWPLAAKWFGGPAQ